MNGSTDQHTTFFTVNWQYVICWYCERSSYDCFFDLSKSSL